MDRFGSTLCAALAVAGLCVGAAPHPVSAARPAGVNLEGSYSGTFRSTSGSVLQCDLAIFQQLGRRLDGEINVAAVHRQVIVTGRCSRSGSLTLVGRSGSGRNISQLKIRGRFRPEGNSGNGVIEGSYLVTGATRDRGTFTARGGGG